MKIKKKCVAMLLAGGQGSRLYALTQKVAKPAIPYGGKNRFIDFPLSNCINSGIDTVGVLTQYQPMVLNEYIGNGQPWDLDKMHGGVHVLPPYQTAAGASWYEGTANAIYQNIAFIERYDPEYVIVLGGDHIYKMDYSKMLDYHIANEADHRCHRCSPFRSLPLWHHDLRRNRKNHRLYRKAKGAKVHTGFYGHLCFLLGKAQEIPH